jgi:hypothetical protein
VAPYTEQSINVSAQMTLTYVAMLATVGGYLYPYIVCCNVHFSSASAEPGVHVGAIQHQNRV